MASRASGITDAQIRQALEQTNGNATKAAALVGLSPSRMRERRIALAAAPGVEPIEVGARARSGDITFSEPVSSKLLTSELIERRLAEFDRVKAAHVASRIMDVFVADDLPIAVTNFGDPHLDDPGTDLRQLISDTNVVNATDGMYAGCIGDLQNNWIGRIAHLWGQQETTAEQSWQLVEWWIHEVKRWLYLTDGNHDHWSGNGDPLHWITGMQGRRMIHERNEVRIRLNFPNGFQYIIAARHSWPGNSQWNPAHGEFKAALMRVKADLILSGHTHTSLDASLYVEAHDIVTRCARVGSYKVIDRYAVELGLQNKQIAPSITVVIDPRATTPTSRGQVFYDVDRAARYLTMLREGYQNVQSTIH